MRITKIRWKRAGRPNWALPFFAGFMAGAAVVYLNTGVFLSGNGLLSQSSLERIAGMELNKGAFFLYVLEKRIGMLWLMAILATTFAGIVTTYLFILWIGVCGGVVFMVSVMRYGMKGILLLAGGMMPHFLCYIPAILLLADWCLRVCGKLYYPVRDYTAIGEEKSKNRWILWNFLMLHGVVIIGAVLESYVNPNLIAELCKIF